MKPSKKPSRKDLLIALNRAQTLFGRIPSATQDQNRNRASDLDKLVRAGMDLCMAALGEDSPTDKMLPKHPPLRIEIERVDKLKLGLDA